MSRPKSTLAWSAARDCLPISKVATVAAEVRAGLKIAFGVPPLGGTGPEPPKGGTPNLRLRISVGFFRHARRRRTSIVTKKFRYERPPLPPPSAVLLRRTGSPPLQSRRGRDRHRRGNSNDSPATKLRCHRTGPKLGGAALAPRFINEIAENLAISFRVSGLVALDIPVRSRLRCPGSEAGFACRSPSHKRKAGSSPRAKGQRDRGCGWKRDFSRRKAKIKKRPSAFPCCK